MYYTHLSYLCQGIAALLLVLLYFWRHRSRKLIVPALFLWDIREIQAKSGHRWQITRLPLPFYLELICILLLALAATSPFFLRKSEIPALCVILDDSLSMLAKESGSTVCDRQLPLIKKALAKSSQVTWITAGTVPRRITAEPAGSIPLSQWKCQAPKADLQGAIALARTFRDNQNILVVTDHKPDFELPADIHWSAKGKSLPNVGIVNAHRGDSKVLLELFNSATNQATISIKANGTPIKSILLSPKTTTKLDLPTDKETNMHITLDMPGDAIELDNAVLLLPNKRPPLSYRVQDGMPSAQATLLRNTLAFSKEYIGIGSRELLIGDENLPKGAYHRLIWHTFPHEQASRTTHAVTFVDRFDALTRGLSRNELQWYHSKELAMPGDGVAFHGETKLLSLQKNGDYFDIHLNLQLEGSNLPHLPFWPALFWNLSDFLRQQRPGPNKTNLRIDEPFDIHVPNRETARLDGTTLLPLNGIAQCHLSTAGLHEITLEKYRWQLSANPLSLHESDLSHAETLEIQPVHSAEKRLATIRNSLSPLLLCLALAILQLHWLIITKPQSASLIPARQ